MTKHYWRRTGRLAATDFFVSALLVAASRNDGANAADSCHPKQTAGFCASIAQCGQTPSLGSFVNQYVTLRTKTPLFREQSDEELEKMDPPLGTNFVYKKANCYFLSYVVLYNKYQCIIDSIDTEPFEDEYYDVYSSREDQSIPTDPRKIAIDMQYTIDLFAPNPKYASYKYNSENRVEFTRVFEKDAIGRHACSKYLRFVGVKE
jgi:hypothetical protein